MLKTRTLKRICGLAAAFAVILTTLTVLSGASTATFKTYPPIGAEDGDVFTYTLGGGTLIIGSEGDPANFKGIRIGEYVLSANVYVVAGDVCNVAISGNYLGSFDAGEYPVRMEFSDGLTTATLKIVEPGSEDDAAEASEAEEASTAPESSAPEKAPDAAMLEGGAEVPATAQNLINTGLDTVMVGFLALTGGSAALFGLGKKWLK